MLRVLVAPGRRLISSPDSFSSTKLSRAFLSRAAFCQRVPASCQALPTPSDPRRHRDEDSRALQGGARAFSASTAGVVGIDITTNATTTTTAITSSSMPGVETLLAPLEARDGTLLEPLGWLPQDIVLEAMAYAHDAFGLTWGVTIVASVLLARAAVLPMQIWVAQKMSRMALAKPELDMIIARQKATPGMDPAVGAKEIRDLYAKHKVNPITTILTPFLQMPLFIAFFFGTRKVRQLRFVRGLVANERGRARRDAYACPCVVQ
jgi:hypothetical protein